MIKEQFHILDSGDLGHTRQVTAEQHLVYLSHLKSVSACQHWQPSALILECRVSTCQQLPVTGARQLISLFCDLKDILEFAVFWPSGLILKNPKASSEFT